MRLDMLVQHIFPIFGVPYSLGDFIIDSNSYPIQALYFRRKYNRNT